MNGPMIYFTIPILGGIPITQTTVSSFLVMVILCVTGGILGRHLQKRPSGRQVLTEKLITTLYDMVGDTMGRHNLYWAPYIGTLFLSSALGSLIGMTSVLVWVCSIRANGVWGWLKGYAEPVAVMLPMNIVSEIAQPISMAFRHFGNIMGGGVLTSLLYSALAAASSLIFGWLPGLLGEIPFLQVGIPAVLSLYFDIFSGFVQALVFSLLTMVYVGNACPPPEIE